MASRSAGNKVGLSRDANPGGGVSKRVSYSPWHLRSFQQRLENMQGIAEPTPAKEIPEENDAEIPSRAKDIFCKIEEDATTTRRGLVDGKVIEFELQSKVNTRPTTSREERFQDAFKVNNVVVSNWELRGRWWLFRYSLATITVIYLASFLAVNFAFAALWSIQDGKCCDDNAMKYTQIFDFAIQTSTTIGYGGYTPHGYFSNFLVVMLSFIALVLNTVYGGLLFLKFVSPTAKIEFSEVMTLSNVNGIPCLELRMGNADGVHNLLQDVTVRLSYSYHIAWVDETGADRNFGQSQELRLLSDKRTRLDGMVWTVRHVLDETSPLFGVDFQEHPGTSIYHLEVSLNATQAHTGAPIFCRTAYRVEDIMIGQRFVDQISVNDDKSVYTFDYSKLHDIIPHPVWYPTKRKNL